VALRPPCGPIAAERAVAESKHVGLRFGLQKTSLRQEPEQESCDKNMDTKYWLVGSAFGGTEHKDEEFVSKGIWVLGHKKGKQREKASEISVGDRIAMKRLLGGRGQDGMRILHIGVVRNVYCDAEMFSCDVKWDATYVSRIIGKSKGCRASIHGPFFRSDPERKQWIEEIFSL
jgi:hypothetical protein